MSRFHRSGHTYPFQVASSLADSSLLTWAATYFERGGAMGRARAELSRGGTPARSVTAASMAGKGFAAEMRVAAEFNAHSALLGLDVLASPNPVSNAPHADVQFHRGGRIVGDAQVGVGEPARLRTKARRSKASQVVVPKEVVREVRRGQRVDSARVRDRLEFDGAASRPVSENGSRKDATAGLTKALLGSRAGGILDCLGHVADAGAEGFLFAFGRALLAELVVAHQTGAPLDASIVERAARAGARGALVAGTQTLLVVDSFLDVCGPAFDAKLLHAFAGKAVWAGALAEIIVSTAEDITRCLRCEITFDELGRNFIMTTAGALGAAASAAMILRLCRGLPWPVSAFLVLVCAGAGAQLAEGLAAGLIEPRTVQD